MGEGACVGHASECTGVVASVCTCKGLRAQVSLYHSLPYCLSLIGNPTIWDKLAGQRVLWIHLSCPLSVWVTDTHSHACFLHVYWRFKSGSSCLHSKNLSPLSCLPAPSCSILKLRGNRCREVLKEVVEDGVKGLTSQE